MSPVAVAAKRVGPLAYLLRNRFYVGEVAFKGDTLTGEQPAIVDRDLFDAVQAKLSEQVTNHKLSRTKSEALLLGRIYDDRGHRMTPSHVRKGGIKYRYYISSALLQGRAKQAGTVSRIFGRRDRGPRRKICSGSPQRTHRDRGRNPRPQSGRPDRGPIGPVVHRTHQCKRCRSQRAQSQFIEVPWRKTPSTRRRELLLPDSASPQEARPIRSENRALLVASIARGRRWLDELMTDPTANTESIANREACTVRKVNMDDLARVPRAGFRQGGHRWAPSPWNGRGPTLRPPRRMVAPASGARFCAVETFEPRLC